MVIQQIYNCKSLSDSRFLSDDELSPGRIAVSTMQRHDVPRCIKKQLQSC